MKRYIKTLLIALPLMTAGINMSAIVADPRPVKVTQPDGTTLTIRLHGDEFLNWATCGNSLVAMGDDGFYRFASFEDSGVSVPSGARVTSTPSGDGLSVRPPRSAIQKAKQARAGMSKAAASIRAAAAEVNAVTGEDHFLVMLIGFDDLPFSVDNPHDAFYNMINQEGYSDYGGTGSVRDYYIDQSLGKFKPDFDVFGPYNVDGKMSSYSKEDGCTQNGAPRLLAEACEIADSEVDFSKYDYDGDGYVDNVFFYYAGYCASSGNNGTIWPHSWYVSSSPLLDGVRLFYYACASEYDGTKPNGVMASIGTFCHEFAHTIGLPDFYDTDYEDQGQGYGLGNYSLMSSGNYNNHEKTPPYFNCEERKMLGWMESVPNLPQKTRRMTLAPVQGNEGFVSGTDNDNEYFLFEYRNGTGWDAPLNPGLVIYHVDKSNNDIAGYSAAYRWQNGYQINAYANHECFKLMLANADYDIVPFGGDYTEFSFYTSPSFQSWSGNDTGLSLSEISHDGEKATFKLNCATADLFSEEGICAIETGSSLRAGDEFTFELVEIENAPSSVKWFFDDVETLETSVILTAGEHTVKAEISWDNGDSGSYSAVINVK